MPRKSQRSCAQTFLPPPVCPLQVLRVIRLDEAFVAA